MRWTSRLKRFGGRAGIVAARARQEALFAAILDRGCTDHIAGEIQAIVDWLAGHPLRALGQHGEAYWRWQLERPVRDVTIVDVSGPSIEGALRPPPRYPQVI